MRTLTSFKATDCVFVQEAAQVDKRKSGTITFTYSCAADILLAAAQLHTTEDARVMQEGIKGLPLLIPTSVVSGLGILYMILLQHHNPKPDDVLTIPVDRQQVEGLEYLLSCGLVQLEAKRQQDKDLANAPEEQMEHPYVQQFDADKYIRMKILLLELRNWLAVQTRYSHAA